MMRIITKLSCHSLTGCHTYIAELVLKEQKEWVEGGEKRISMRLFIYLSETIINYRDYITTQTWEWGGGVYILPASKVLAMAGEVHPAIYISVIIL